MIQVIAKIIKHQQWYQRNRSVQDNKLSLYDSHKEWSKCAFGIELNNIYDIKILNDMNRIHDNKLNNISE